MAAHNYPVRQKGEWKGQGAYEDGYRGFQKVDSTEPVKARLTWEKWIKS
jgi:hypothetical protein